MAKFYSIYVGIYDTPKIPKEDVKKLNNLGLKAYIFSTSKGYSLKVYTSPDLNMANMMIANLKNYGFDAWME